jgi:hypothetical protein
LNTALLRSVSRLAGLTVGCVVVAGHPAEATPVNLLPDRQVQGAFTEVPEVLKAYSRALALYQAGYPEYSVELFRSAF